MKNKEGIYSHIILDDLEKYTKAEIDFIRRLFNKKEYSNFIFTLNSELEGRENSWIVKGRNLPSLGIDTKGKTFNYKLNLAEKKKKVIDTIEKYQYINLRNNNVVILK